MIFAWLETLAASTGMALVLVVGGLSSLLGHLQGLRANDRDAGHFWSMVLWAFPLLMVPLLLLSSALPGISALELWWFSPFHLYLDEADPSGMHQIIALLFPLLVYLGVLGWAVLRTGHHTRSQSSWLVGSVGFNYGRNWILGNAVPLLIIVIRGGLALWSGRSGFPGAVWSTLVLVLMGLLGISLSSSTGTEKNKVTEKTLPPPLLPDWPTAMASQQFQLKAEGAWPADGGQRVSLPRSVLGRWVQALGNRQVDGRLVEAMDRLLNPPDGRRESAMMVIAPDECGQREVVSGAATLRFRQYREKTLIITGGSPESLKEELQGGGGSLVPADVLVSVGSRHSLLSTDSAVWIVDAETLSEYLLAVLAASPTLLDSVGLIIWWDCHRWSGVLAANVWAISRRMDRLLRSKGRVDVPALVLIRSMGHASGQLGRFVQRLLPYQFETRTTIQITPTVARPLHIYTISSNQTNFLRSLGSAIPHTSAHPLLLGTLASVRTHWVTHISPPPMMSESEIGGILSFRGDGDPIRARLAHGPADAGARLLMVEEEDVLSLRAMLAQGGRTTELPHHVALSATGNGYSRFLLQRWATAPDSIRCARRLVGAEGTPFNVQRHLVRALGELEDTFFGLRQTFNWEVDAIRQTLNQLKQENQLSSTEVRFLDRRGQLHVDQEYSVRISSATVRRPLDTVGRTLIMVREKEAAQGDEGLRMAIDSERLGIQAYPGCVFLHRGQRYRIRQWTRATETLSSISCQLEERHVETFRVRNARVLDLSALPGKDAVRFGPRLSMGRQMVTLNYQEDVRGMIEVVLQELETGRTTKHPAEHFVPINVTFQTRGLLLEFHGRSEGRGSHGLASICRLLQEIIPVHLGVERQAIAVVPLLDGRVQEAAEDMTTSQARDGVVIVDLYPGGVGLIDAIYEDEHVVLEMLRMGREWLLACPCQSGRGCENCLDTPEAEASRYIHQFGRAAALSALEFLMEERI